MATSYLFGFELQSAGGEESPVNISPSYVISTAVFHGGAGKASGRFNSSTGSPAQFRKRTASGTLLNFAQSASFYIRIDVIPSTSARTLFSTLSGAGVQLVLNNPAGTLSISDANGTGSVTSSNAFIADAQWHRVDIDVSTTTRTVYVDGVLWAQATGLTTATPQNTVNFGGAAGVTGGDYYLDDLRVDDGSIGAPVAGNTYFLALSLPTAGNNAGSWTDGAGGTGDIHAGVASTPPQGSAAATAGIKIKNAVSGTALDYVATMQTYNAAGIPAGSTINAIQAICNDGEEVTTGTKSGGVWCASNPAQSAVVVGAGLGFDYGDDIGLLATFPSNWATHVGVVAVTPSVTLGTAPTVTVRKGSSTTRVVDVDFMGLYVDYTSPPIAKNIAVLQAVRRASFF